MKFQNQDHVHICTTFS